MKGKRLNLRWVAWILLWAVIWSISLYLTADHWIPLHFAISFVIGILAYHLSPVGKMFE